MTPLIYHGTPITPNAAMLDVMAGRAACVSYARPDQVHLTEAVCPEAMFDNGAFTAFTKGRTPDWPGYYAWLEPLLAGTRWAVIPDVIDAGSQLQDALLSDWPYGGWGAPVWHTNEPIARLLRLCARWPRVCIGSTDEHWHVGGDPWRRRMDEAWSAFGNRYPKIHMLRWTAVARDYPFCLIRQLVACAEWMAL